MYSNAATLLWLSGLLPGRSDLVLLPSGTSSNEALHAEIKTWFAQTQQMHQSTLILKLRVLKYAKQLPHFIALKHPTLSQMSSQLLLVRLVAVSMWRDVTWTAWCKTTVENDVVAKAKVPLHEARVEEAAKVSAWLKKRPAAKPPRAAACRKKRTVFTMEREHSLRRQGTIDSNLRRG